MSIGLVDAHSYPLGFVADEVTLVVERQNAMLASEGTIFHAAGAAIMSKKGGEHFNAVIKRLTETQ